MAHFMLVYLGGTPPASPEEGKAMMEKWKAWVGENARVLVEPQNPVGVFKSVGADGISDKSVLKPMSGYSVIDADDMDAAMTIAQSCPFLEMDTATIDVAEIKKMG